MWKLPPGEAPAVGVHAQPNKWYHDVEVGGKEFIQSLEDSHLKSVELKVLPYPIDSFQTTVAAINSFRHENGLTNISFSF